ncbi:aldehyde dehydrogenase [Microthyrium microscopicum]|uniref:Aldehyde dehydrogenase n=1 Tax=Microthyrium microscopicum TaxID=703497 RepID=A0A6A6U5G4_9PEZI|nr:aldehyde dehydrogenase [Microthyrium microscopicum]
MSDDTAAIKQLEEALAIQKKAFLKNQCPSAEERKANVGKIPAMVLSNRDAIREALNKDFGNHAQTTTDLVEVLGVAGRAAYVISKIDEWMKYDRRDMDAQMYGDGIGEVRYQPKGVIGNIVPWNFPVDLSLGPLCEMLAAGNRVIIKPSEFTPNIGALLAKMISDAYPADLVTVINGGLDLSKRFSQLKFNHILYTGNPAVGKLVMGEAAKNLTPVTLELGGKCPVIMTKGSVNAENVENILGTKMLKNGQMCITPDYVLVPEGDVEAFTGAAEKLFMEKLPNYAQNADNTGIISERHLKRITGMIEEAEKAGVKSIELGGEAAKDNSKRQLPMTLLVNPGRDLSVMKEEIFGPVLPIIPYSNLEDAIDEVNDGERPLGLYVYSDDLDAANKIIDNTNSGGAAINCAAMQGALPSLGFGGSGNSGMGRHHGVEGFREFSNPRGVVTRDAKRQDMIAAFMPPFAALGQPMADAAYKQAMGLA